MQPNFFEIIALTAALAVGTFVLFPFFCFTVFG